MPKHQLVQLQCNLEHFLQYFLEVQNERQYPKRDFHQEHPSINDKMAKVKLDQILQKRLHNLDLCSRNFLEFLDEL